MASQPYMHETIVKITNLNLVHEDILEPQVNSRGNLQLIAYFYLFITTFNHLFLEFLLYIF